MGDIVRRLMEVRSITDKQLEARSGISAKLISLVKSRKYEQTHKMKFYTARALANALEVPTQLLLNAPYIVEVERKKEEKY